MADWNRTDYDRLESDERWTIRVFSEDPIRGISPILFGYLLVALSLLAAAS